MWRYLAGGVAAILMVGAGWLLFGSHARPEILAATAPRTSATPTPGADDPLPAALPAAPPRDREQKRFDRYDKDRDGRITAVEYLVPRRKAFAKLDKNGDGRLSFEEWATRTTTRFQTADADRSGAMSAAEFATTAPKRRAGPACRCPAAATAGDD
jgi:hypothetical protein